jgi:hypothetical protein
VRKTIGASVIFAKIAGVYVVPAANFANYLVEIPDAVAAVGADGQALAPLQFLNCADKARTGIEDLMVDLILSVNPTFRQSKIREVRKR